MYKICRDIHLALSLVVTPFLLLYAFSALIFSFHFLDDKTVDSSVESFELSSFSADPTNLLVVLADKYGVRGELKKSVVYENGKFELLISKPGSDYEISVDPQIRLLTIKENTQSVERFIKALHTRSGFESTYFAEQWWGLAVVLVAAMLAGIVVTGVILWSYNCRERRSGLLFLGSSLIYCTTVMVVLRFG